MTSSALTPNSEYMEAQNFELAITSDEALPILSTSFPSAYSMTGLRTSYAIRKLVDNSFFMSLSAIDGGP